MSDFLDTVVAERRAAAAALAPDLPVAPRARPSLAAAIRARRGPGRPAVIAELKRRSPALGTLDAAADPVARAVAYVAGGAAAISVLTEPRHWGGSIADLRAVSAAVALPVLCKDVIVSPAQIRQAAAAGAAAVLLIAEALDDPSLASLLACAAGLGLEALVEAHEPAAFARAVASGATVVGVNARDLRAPAAIDRGRVAELADLVRPDQLLVAESGIASPADIGALPARVDAVLVGTALMRAADPATAVRVLAGGAA